MHNILCTGKYHESVGRIGTCVTGTSANAADRRVIFPSTLCIIMYILKERNNCVNMARGDTI